MDKLNKKLNKNKEKITNLELGKRSKIYDAIKEIENEYDSKIEHIKKINNKLIEAKYFKLDEILKIIEYLVNGIENDNYTVEKYDVIIKGYKITKASGISKSKIPYSGKVICLVNSNNKDAVYKYFSNNEFEQNELNKACQEYIQITYYKNTVSNKISISNDFIPITNVSNDIEFKINNDNYNYILDFINDLYEYKIDKEDVNITFEEMIMLADEYIKVYKDIKKLIKI